LRGRYVENAVGALLWRYAQETGTSVHYWNNSAREVDFVVNHAGCDIAIEVKAGSKSRKVSGLVEFKRRFPRARILLVGAEGVPLETVFGSPPSEWLSLAS
jgi:predicted AAA+ superfamily ATPase